MQAVNRHAPRPQRMPIEKSAQRAGRIRGERVKIALKSAAVFAYLFAIAVAKLARASDLLSCSTFNACGLCSLRRLSSTFIGFGSIFALPGENRYGKVALWSGPQGDGSIVGIIYT